MQNAHQNRMERRERRVFSLVSETRQYSIFGFSFLMRMKGGGPGSLAVGPWVDGAYMIPTNIIDSQEVAFLSIYFPPTPPLPFPPPHLHSIIMI